MSSYEALCVRFPGGKTELTLSTARPVVGDRVKRGEDEWEVVAVERHSDGNTGVELAVPATGHSAR